VTLVVDLAAILALVLFTLSNRALVPLALWPLGSVSFWPGGFRGCPSIFIIAGAPNRLRSGWRS
jgi:hypothetical protein